MGPFKIGFFTQYNAIQVVVCINSFPFLLLRSIPWYGCTTVYFNYSSIVGHFGPLQFGAVRNKAANEQSCTGFFVDLSFHFSGINA